MIGVGIVTYNRPKNLFKLLNSLENCDIDYIVVVNDGEYYDEELFFDNLPKKLSKIKLIQNSSNLGVGKSKNKALEFLLERKCEHLFLIEDDIFIKDKNVFDIYINSSKETGIQHFNYSQHGIMNKDRFGNPKPIMILEYKSVKIPLFRHCVGAFSYYSAKILEKTGLIFEKYYNACEHVDHTLCIIKELGHPPFWYFADVEDSQNYLGDEEWSMAQSTISSRSDRQDLIKNADSIFFERHGCFPVEIELKNEDDVIENIKIISKKWKI